LIVNSNVGFPIFGEKSNGCFASARVPAMGTYAEDPVMQSDSFGHALGSHIRLDHMAAFSA
jgi:hypothetical protein